MCTVTFIPGDGYGYILTSSRDEHSTRPSAAGPAVENHTDYKLIYPKDPKGGGTWIASNNFGKSVCLFNGAFKAHTPNYPYRHSRGVIVLDIFKYGTTEKFMEDYNLINIEPFTLIIVHGKSLEEFKWDGNKTYLMKHDFSMPKIWSSVTLYSSDIVKLRESWFDGWKKKYIKPEQENILDFHLTAGNGRNENDVLMERKTLSLKTVSITSVLASENKITMEYLDLLRNNTHIEELFTI